MLRFSGVESRGSAKKRQSVRDRFPSISVCPAQKYGVAGSGRMPSTAWQTAKASSIRPSSASTIASRAASFGRKRQPSAIRSRLRPNAAASGPIPREPSARGATLRRPAPHSRAQQRDGSFPFADRLKSSARSADRLRPRNRSSRRARINFPICWRSSSAMVRLRAACARTCVPGRYPDRRPLLIAAIALTAWPARGNAEAAEPSPMVEAATSSRRTSAGRARMSAMISSSEFFAKSMPQ